VAQDLTDFEAKVVTARLGADGILWELRGIVDSMYPLGGIDVLVPVDELEAAQHSLLGEPGVPDGVVTPVERDGTGDFEETGDHRGSTARPPVPRPPGAPRRWWLTAAVIVGVAAFCATRIVAAVVWLQDERRDCSPHLAAEGLTLACRH
jgi:hypothetical protein